MGGKDSAPEDNQGHVNIAHPTPKPPPHVPLSQTWERGTALKKDIDMALKRQHEHTGFSPVCS